MKEGMPLVLTIGAITGETFDANLEYISPKGTESSGAVLFEIKAAVSGANSAFIRSGYSANAEIVLASATDVLTIPESSGEFSNDSAFVYVLTTEEREPKQEFERQPITVGLSDGINIEVKDGITLQEQLRGSAIDPKKKKEETK